MVQTSKDGDENVLNKMKTTNDKEWILKQLS